MEQMNNNFKELNSSRYVAVIAFSKHSPDYDYVRFPIPTELAATLADAEEFVKTEATKNNMAYIGVEIESP